MTIEEIAKQITKTDLQLLLKLYKLRCLTLSQSWRVTYKSSGMTFKTFFKNKIRKFCSEYKIITIQNNNNSEFCIQLTKKGIEVMRKKLKIPKKIYNKELNLYSDPLLSIKDVRIMSRLFPHQTALNEFVINFEELYPKLKYPQSFRYFDEKYVSQYSFIRPDGLIRIGNLDLFLEQDMGTESRKQLNDKWNKYRRFLNIRNSSQKIVVLFIVTCDKEEQRKQLIRTTASQVFTKMLDDNFDVYIGNRTETLLTVFKKILPIHFKRYSVKTSVVLPLKKHGYSISNARSLNVIFGGSAYGYYARIIRDKGVLISNGTAQEWLVDEYSYHPMSVLSKIDYATRTSADFKIRYKRGIKYLVICSSFEDIFEDLKAACSFPLKNVCFTTPERLNTMDIHKALCTIQEDGTVEHFISTAFRGVQFEYKINEKTAEENPPEHI